MIDPLHVAGSPRQAANMAIERSARRTTLGTGGRRTLDPRSAGICEPGPRACRQQCRNVRKYVKVCESQQLYHGLTKTSCSIFSPSSIFPDSGPPETILPVGGNAHLPVDRLRVPCYP